MISPNASMQENGKSFNQLLNSSGKRSLNCTVSSAKFSHFFSQLRYQNKKNTEVNKTDVTYNKFTIWT